MRTADLCMRPGRPSEHRIVTTCREAWSRVRRTCAMRLAPGRTGYRASRRPSGLPSSLTVETTYQGKSIRALLKAASWANQWFEN